MPTDPDTDREAQRIQSVYAERDRFNRSKRYHWDHSDVRYFDACKERLFSRALSYAFDGDLSEVRVLDVGCGTGGFLRKLTEWGANPKNLLGTEFLENRLETARDISPCDINWHLGDLSSDLPGEFDLVSAHTVFSSILDDAERLRLADQILARVKPGGWIMVFDFRYNNPSNSNVLKVSTGELGQWWPQSDVYYLSGLLAPPLARRLVTDSWLLAELLTTFIPVLRSHFVYITRKPE